MINPMELTGQCIMVTGASTGIGREIAIHLDRLGAAVVLVSRNEEKLSEVRNALQGSNHYSFTADLSQEEEIRHLFENLEGQGVLLTGLVHSAGMQSIKPLQVLDRQDMEEVMQLNYYAFLSLAKYFSKKKYHRNGGSIVAISTIASLTGSKGFATYSGSKAALEGSVRSLAVELAAKKIRVNSVLPGWIQTGMYERFAKNLDEEGEKAILKRQLLGIGEPVDVANAVAFLLSDAARFITGTSLIVDGGYTAQ